MAGSLRFGPFRLDLADKQLWRGEESIELTPKALDVLIYLVEHAGEVVTREQLFEALWPDVFVADHALSVQILEIRKALNDDVHRPNYVQTRHRRGYRFIAPVTRVPAKASVEIRVPETHYVDSGGTTIAYQVIGEGPIDLVFVMGWVSHLEYFWTEPRFARFLQRLSSFTRVILFDKRGTGLSDRVPLDRLPTIEQRMEDVHAVMDKVGSQRAIICGVSEGGCMSAVFAATYPERAAALIMIATYARRIWAPDYPWAPTTEQRQHLLQEIREHWGGPIGIEERAPSVASDPHFREWWAAYLRMGASPGAALALTTMNTETDIRHVLPLVRVPTLVLHRTGDLCLKVEEGRYIASKIPDAQLIEVPGKDHLPFVGDQDSILQPIEAFVKQLQGGFESVSFLATALVVAFEAG
ncbi:MAG TPA: alpha/beta fold hydrolase, partial [Bryobacteraceae bacterium]|nr:alpha/beta fold hydrolase [Bryobacteraceae bacterium]